MPSLQSLWKEGREGALSPLEQMRAWALREAQKDLGARHCASEVSAGRSCAAGAPRTEEREGRRCN